MLSRSERAVAAIALLNAIWNDRDPKAIRSRIGQEYVRHNPTNTEGVEAVLRDVAAVPSGLAAVIAPQRSLADGEFAAVHSQYLWSPLGLRDEGSGFAAVDMFRFDSGGKVVEHWHRVQPVPTPSVNSNTMFNGGGDPGAATDPAVGKSLIHRLYKAFREGDLAAIGELRASDYRQHSGGSQRGSESATDRIRRSGSVDVTLQLVIAEGDLVFALTEMDAGARAGAEMYRVAAGRMAEHWDVIQPRGGP